MVSVIILIMLIKSIISRSLLGTRTLSYSFGVMDKLHENRKQKAIDEFKKKMAFLANKPSYTYLDLKQTVADELSQSQSIRGKLSKETSESASKMESDIKILNAFFDEELTDNKLLDSIQMNEISLTTGVPLPSVEKLVKYFSHMKKMHLYLRSLKEQGLPLPKDVKEMRAGLMENASELRDESEKKEIKQRRKHSRRDIVRHIKFSK